MENKQVGRKTAGQFELLTQKRFFPFFVTQFLGVHRLFLFSKHQKAPVIGSPLTWWMNDRHANPSVRRNPQDAAL